MKATKVLRLIHSNIWGPTKTPSIEGAQYFMTFITIDLSQKVFCYFMKNKGIFLQNFCNIIQGFC